MDKKQAEKLLKESDNREIRSVNENSNTQLHIIASLELHETAFSRIFLNCNRINFVHISSVKSVL